MANKIPEDVELIFHIGTIEHVIAHDRFGHIVDDLQAALSYLKKRKAGIEKRRSAKIDRAIKEHKELEARLEKLKIAGGHP